MPARRNKPSALRHSHSLPQPSAILRAACYLHQASRPPLRVEQRFYGRPPTTAFLRGPKRRKCVFRLCECALSRPRFRLTAPAGALAWRTCRCGPKLQQHNRDLKQYIAKLDTEAVQEATTRDAQPQRLTHTARQTDRDQRSELRDDRHLTELRERHFCRLHPHAEFIPELGQVYQQNSCNKTVTSNATLTTVTNKRQQAGTSRRTLNSTSAMLAVSGTFRACHPGMSPPPLPPYEYMAYLIGEQMPSISMRLSWVLKPRQTRCIAFCSPLSRT